MSFQKHFHGKMTFFRKKKLNFSNSLIFVLIDTYDRDIFFDECFKTMFCARFISCILNFTHEVVAKNDIRNQKMFFTFFLTTKLFIYIFRRNAVWKILWESWINKIFWKVPSVNDYIDSKKKTKNLLIRHDMLMLLHLILNICMKIGALWNLWTTINIIKNYPKYTERAFVVSIMIFTSSSFSTYLPLLLLFLLLLYQTKLIVTLDL